MYILHHSNICLFWSCLRREYRGSDYNQEITLWFCKMNDILIRDTAINRQMLKIYLIHAIRYKFGIIFMNLLLTMVVNKNFIFIDWPFNDEIFNQIYFKFLDSVEYVMVSNFWRMNSIDQEWKFYYILITYFHGSLSSIIPSQFYIYLFNTSETY